MICWILLHRPERRTHPATGRICPTCIAPQMGDRTMGDWIKQADNPVLGPGYCRQAVFDCCVVPLGDRLRMWLSWRDLHSIAVSDSDDGVHWTAPHITLEPEPANAWE